MKTLKAWLDEGRGRYTELAAHLGVSVGRVSQMADDGVPPKFMLAVRAFTKEEVSLEAMVAARTPAPKDGTDPNAHAVAQVSKGTQRPQREGPNRTRRHGPS
jgi:hypothetical protein